MLPAVLPRDAQMGRMHNPKAQFFNVDGAALDQHVISKSTGVEQCDQVAAFEGKRFDPFSARCADCGVSHVRAHPGKRGERR